MIIIGACEVHLRCLESPEVDDGHFDGQIRRRTDWIESDVDSETDYRRSSEWRWDKSVLLDRRWVLGARNRCTGRTRSAFVSKFENLLTFGRCRADSIASARGNPPASDCCNTTN